MPDQDKFGFQFWLSWILSFAGGFVAAAVIWTLVLTGIFGKIEQPEHVMTWSVAVFGSWFLILTPFMRKKEQIWKRLNADEEKATTLWHRAMGIFVLLLIGSLLFWSWQMRESLGRPGLDRGWLKNVFVSWLILTLPFLIFLYQKADQLFKAATLRQTETKPLFRSAFLEQSKRILPEAVALSLEKIPETLRQGHVVNLFLKDGRKVEHVFIYKGKEVLGIYDAPAPSFEASEVVALENVSRLPAYEASRWLRLDGRA